MDLRTDHSERLLRIRAKDAAKRFRGGDLCAQGDGNYVPVRPSRSVHLKINFQLDKQAVRY